MWYDNVELSTEYNYISSKIRFARNFDNTLFPNKLTDTEAKKLVEDTLCKLSNISLDLGMHTSSSMLNRIPEVERMSMCERNILNDTLAKKETPTGIILNDNEDTGIIINADDHIRLQTMSAGIKLYELLEKANKIDDYINEHFDYAFSDKYGYLTTYPTNIGTGMRASILLHLPASTRNKGFSKLIANAGRFGVSIRGLYGEGMENFGTLYEISNSKTLGISEREIIDTVTKVANQLNENERKLREAEAVSEVQRTAREDEAYKAYGLLKYARKLNIRDAMNCLSLLMKGCADGFINIESPNKLYSIMLGIQSYNILNMAGSPLSEDYIEIHRAEYIRENIGKLK